MKGVYIYNTQHHCLEVLKKTHRDGLLQEMGTRTTEREEEAEEVRRHFF